MALKVSVGVFRFKCPHNDVLAVGQQGYSCFWCSKPMTRTYLGEITISVGDSRLHAEVTRDRIPEIKRDPSIFGLGREGL